MAQLEAVAEELGRTIAAVRAVLSELDAAYRQVDEILDGAAGHGDVEPPLLAAHEQATDLLDVLAVVEWQLRAYLARASPGIKPAPEPPRPLVERLRRELPPDIIPPHVRPRGTPPAKTHARWVGPDGVVHVDTSGRDAKYQQALLWFEAQPGGRIPRRASDVEMKLAVHMRLEGIRSVTVVINHVPCPGEWGCDALVPKILPPGSSMTIHGAGGFLKTYRGEA